MRTQGGAPGVLPPGTRLIEGDGSNPTPTPKWVRVLSALLERSTLDRFEAVRDPKIRDWVLPTTVSQLEQRGLNVAREIVEVPGYGGSTARIARYSLAPDQRRRALELLGK